MIASLYSGKGKKAAKTGGFALPTTSYSELADPELYLAGDKVVDAVNVALLLGRPLLVNGEPGTGKTHLAYSVAWELGLGDPLKFETKSTSSARDLFYTYDVLGRFHASQLGEDISAIRYMTYSALGLAIIRANDPKSIASQLPKPFVHGGKRQSLVLIDEIDKAPRDFPNDILNEIEDMYFRVPELNNAEFRADPEMRPIVVITSNSEKGLPDAFLRRCIYCYIEFPTRDRLVDIVTNRLRKYVGRQDALLSDALDLFFALRKDSLNLRKKPATAELMGWLISLCKLSEGKDNPLARTPALALRTLPALIKTEEDRQKVEEEVRRWIAGRS
jgi:MoxR-like ATPase